jgi:hypothetical protein
MTRISISLRLLAGCSVALLVASNTGVALAEPLHGEGSSHNPIVHHPVHGYGSSHNPIVTTRRGGGRCSSPGGYLACGTVVHDHRNGKNCSYVAGEYGTYAQYRKCEGM